MSKRSERQRADKFKIRAAAMLDSYHWQKEEEYFLGLMETGILTVSEIRELTWNQVKISYEGLTILEKPVPLRAHLLEGFREMLSCEKGLYEESIAGKEVIGKVFAKETLKNITREVDQFKG